MTLRLKVRRFYCHHLACRRRTFVELLPQLLPSRARRTDRLARAQARVGLALGGEAGARLAGHLAMATSPDTVLRLVHGMTLPSIGPLRAVGTDDWAIRKGQTYGTLLVDLDRRRPIDLLPDRTSTTVAAWLRRHPGKLGSHVLVSVNRRVVYFPLAPAIDPFAQRREPDTEIRGNLAVGPPAHLRQSHRLGTKLRGKGLLPVCHRNPPPSGNELSTFAVQGQPPCSAARRRRARQKSMPRSPAISVPAPDTPRSCAVR